MNYNKLYSRFLESRPLRIKQPNEQLETHHILPRSLGGTDRKDNLIVLTPREHFVAHRLLAKYRGRAMKIALWQMSNQPKHRGYITSRQYDIIRREFIKSRQQEWQERRQNPETYQQHIDSLKQGHRNMDPERRQRASDRMRAYWQDPVQRAQRIAGIRAKSKQAAPATALKTKEWYQTPAGKAYRKRLSEHMKRVNARRKEWQGRRDNSFRKYIKNLTPAQRQKLSDSGRLGAQVRDSRKAQQQS